VHHFDLRHQVVHLHLLALDGRHVRLQLCVCVCVCVCVSLRTFRLAPVKARSKGSSAT
jgi:hypothetical protein